MNYPLFHKEQELDIPTMEGKINEGFLGHGNIFPFSV